MKHNYYKLGLLLALWPLVQLASGQPLTIAGLNPVRNDRSVPQTTNVALTFSQSLSTSAATLDGVRVFSALRGGLLSNSQGGSASVSGSTLTFNPTLDFKPGEPVFVTSTTAIQSTSGARLSRGQVYGFTTGVGGTGRGNFTPPAINPDPRVGDNPNSVAVGDVDGDGDLDLLCANQGSATVSVRLNDGSGNFTAPAINPDPGVGNSPASVALGDVDGDGDLDLLTANQNSATVSVRLNDGSGNFTPPAINPDPGVGNNPISVAVGDVDGDGDLDLLCANQGSATVSVRLNNGSGNFIPPAINPNPGVGSSPYSVALGDVDGDGDLDFVTANADNNTVSVRLNNGSGNFAPPATNPNPIVGSSPLSVVLGDVDGDGDLDLVTANYNSNTVSVRLNNGSGNFTAPAINPSPAVRSSPRSVALGDVDGDGDLDLVTANFFSANVSVRLNNGSGNFTPPTINPNPNVGDNPLSVALGDGDGDGDLDLLCAILSSNTVSVRLNRSLPPTLTGLSASPNPVCGGQPLSVTASVSSGSYSYTLSNGSTAVSGTATTPTFSQSLTAGDSGVQSFTLTVSSDGQVATATTSVTVNAAPTASLVSSGTLSCGVTSVTLTASGGGTYRFSSGATPLTGGNTATVSTAGVYSVTVIGTTGCSAVASTSVSNGLPITVTNPATTSLVASQGVTQAFTASGGQGPYSFSVASGSLPPGLSLATTGMLSGSPTQAGSFTAVIQATDGKGCSGLGVPFIVSVAGGTPSDLTLLLFAQPTLVYGPTTVSGVVSVYELNGVATSGPVSVKLSEDSLLKLGFDPTATSVGGKPVQNSLWQFSGPVDGIYTLTSTQPLPAGGRLSVGLSGPLTPGATKGKLSVSATVVDPSGTETRLNNNQDAETIEYFNK